MVLSAGENVLAYERQHAQTRLLVVLNFSGDARRWNLPPDAGAVRLLLSTGLPTGLDRQQEHLQSELMLRPGEGVVLECL
jgi:alpha-glucosidase